MKKILFETQEMELGIQSGEWVNFNHDACGFYIVDKPIETTEEFVYFVELYTKLCFYKLVSSIEIILRISAFLSLWHPNFVVVIFCAFNSHI